MSTVTVVKGAALAACVAISAFSLPSMAAEDGLCNKNMAINYFLAPEATPQLVEWLRIAYGAHGVRVERPGEAFTKEFNAFRLRVLVDEENILIKQMCG